MTTTVQVIISGNKKVEVQKLEDSGRDDMQFHTERAEMSPGTHKTFNIHDKQYLQIKEIGDFVS
jgi:hypothetical protein